MNLDSIRVHRGPWASWHAKVKKQMTRHSQTVVHLLLEWSL